MKKRKTLLTLFLSSFSWFTTQAQSVAVPAESPANLPAPPFLSTEEVEEYTDDKSLIHNQIQLSFKASLQRLNRENQSIQIAEKGIQIAKAERGKLNAFWYPQLQASGAWVHLSEKMEVKQSLKQFTDPVKDYLHSLLPSVALPGEQFITSLMNQIGSHTLIFPLAPRNLTSVDLSAEWVVFSGGKRWQAAKIGHRMVDLARVNRAQIGAHEQVLLAESYYGLRLAQEIVKVRSEVYKALKIHYIQALKMEACGMIDKAGRLFAQVNMDEAKRALESAEKEERVVQKTLKTLLNQKETDPDFRPSSPLFINDSIPPQIAFLFTVESSNYALDELRLQERIAQHNVNIAKSGYMPNIAIFGKQTLYSHGIQSNLLPRTFIGVGFTWNLFDGLNREKRLRQSRLLKQSILLGEEKVRNDLQVGVDQWYTQMLKAQDNVKALQSTIALSEELVRIRQRSFTEGMATSLEVIDAENLLAKVKVARLAAYYEYDVALMHLLSLCGIPEQFTDYYLPAE